MAPKKPNRRTTTTVTAKKLVEETLEVVVTPVPDEMQEKETNSKEQQQGEEEEKSQNKKPTKTIENAKGKRKKKKRAKVGYGRYIYKVMKQVHPDMGISSKAMIIFDNMMADMFERIAEAAATLSKYVGRTTLTSREIQGAVKMVLPGELGKHAIAEGTKAVVSYITAVSKEDKSKKK